MTVFLMILSQTKTMNTRLIGFIYDKEQIIMRTIEEIISSLNKEQMQFVLTKLAENDNYNQDIIRKYSTGKIIIYDYLQNELLRILNSDIESDFYNYSEDEEDERVYSGYRINETLQNLINEIKENISDPEQAIELLQLFFNTDEAICNNYFFYDSSILSTYNEAAQLFVKYADSYENKEKLKDILIDLISHDKYGCRMELQKILMLYQDAA